MHTWASVMYGTFDKSLISHELPMCNELIYHYFIVKETVVKQ